MSKRQYKAKPTTKSQLPPRMSVRQYAAKKQYGTFKPGYDRTSGFYGRFSGRNSEYKYFDTALSFQVDTTGEVPATGQLVLIPQGVTESSRVGRKCVIKAIQMRFTLAPSQTIGQWMCRICLVLDKQCNGAAAAITDVFTSNGFTPYLNLANSQRFVILKEWVMSGSATATTTADNWASLGNTVYYSPPRYKKFYKKCNIPIEYSSTTGAITEIRSNNIFLTAVGFLADDGVTVSGTCRVRFSDG